MVCHLLLHARLLLAPDDSDGLTLAEGGLGPLAPAWEAEAVPAPAVRTDALETVDVLSLPEIEIGGHQVHIVARGEVPVPIKDPIRDAILGGVLDNFLDLLDLLVGEVTDLDILVELRDMDDRSSVPVANPLDAHEGGNELTVPCDIHADDPDYMSELGSHC